MVTDFSNRIFSNSLVKCHSNGEITKDFVITIIYLGMFIKINEEIR